MEVRCCIVLQDGISVQGENLALKRAVMKARREIDESVAQLFCRRQSRVRGNESSRCASSNIYAKNAMQCDVSNLHS